jgi:transposase
MNGAELRDIAPQYQVHEKTLYRLIVRTDPKGWWHAQYTRHWCNAEEAIDSGRFDRKMKSEVRAADWQMDRLERRRPFLKRHNPADET